MPRRKKRLDMPETVRTWWSAPATMPGERYALAQTVDMLASADQLVRPPAPARPEPREARAQTMCAFCDGRELLIEAADEHGDTWRAACRNCGATGPQRSTADEALAAWERRR